MWTLRRIRNPEKLRQEQELSHLRYLRDEIFSRPDIARMYWHINHPADLDVLTSQTFNTIAATIGQERSPMVTPEHPTANLNREFIDGLAPSERAHLLQRIDTVFRSFGRADLADRLPEEPISESREPS